MTAKKRVKKPRVKKPLVSLLVPVFNEAPSIEPFFDAILPVLKKTKCPYEIVFIDDGSVDATREALQSAKAKHDKVSIIALSRNFGKEAALTAGIDFARGHVVIPIDVDLQDPPELIHKFFGQVARRP